jgi:hypothetical protein
MGNVAGQLLFRKTDRETSKGTPIYMVIGFMAVPDGVLKDENRYMIGADTEMWGTDSPLILTLLNGAGVKLPSEYDGWLAEDLLTGAKWSVPNV